MRPNTLFTYQVPAPTVTAISPNTGSTAGGTSVTITGTNFTGATAVKFGAAQRRLVHGQQRHLDHRDVPGRQPARWTSR